MLGELVAANGCVVFFTVGDLTGGAGVFVTVVGFRVGVDALGVGLVVDKDGLLVGVGVEDLGVALEVGVEDLGGAVDLDEEMMGREVVGVEDRVGLDVGFETVVVLGSEFDVVLDDDDDDVPRIGLLVGVEGLEPEPPDEVGLRGPALGPGDAARCLDTMLVLVATASGCVFDSCTNYQNHVF